MAAAAAPDARVKDHTELAKMQAYLDAQDDPSVVRKVIRVDEDEEFNCVDFALQHGVGRPLAMHPEPPAPLPPAPATASAQRYGTMTATCPDGTIPRLRTKIETLVRFESIDDFFRKTPARFGINTFDGEPSADERTSNPQSVMAAGPTDFHQYAAVRQYVTNIGSQSSLDLRSPTVATTSEFSLSQLWVAGGAGANTETVEAGWQVFPAKYGGYNARLFAYFTPDNYGSGGCYNLDCNKFTQVNNTYALGGAFATYSVPGVSEATAFVRLQMSVDGNWWLAVNNVWLGYWAASYFDVNGIGGGATRVTYGGEIIDVRTGGNHTTTDMGSGYFPSAGYLWAAFQRSLQYYSGTAASPILNHMSVDETIQTGWECYQITNHFDAGGRYIFFGGPGRVGTACF